MNDFIGKYLLSRMHTKEMKKNDSETRVLCETQIEIIEAHHFIEKKKLWKGSERHFITITLHYYSHINESKVKFWLV